MNTNSDSFSKLSPELQQKFINFKNTPRPPDSRTKEEKEQSRSYLRQRISDYKAHKNNEKIHLQNIIQEQVSLRQKPISEIKEFLKSKYLLKAGSHAPNDILRKMYEEVHLAGDIANSNESNLLHNYMNNK